MAIANSTRRRRGRLPKGIYRRDRDGGTVFLALVRLKGFPLVSKTFPTADEAIEWADRTKKELTTQRERGSARPDLPRLTIGGLVHEYLEDSVTKARRSFETIHDRLDWWVLHYGAERVFDFGVIAIREARTKLQPGHAPATVNRYIAVMRRCWNWGRSAGFIPTDRLWPTSVMLEEPKGRTRSLTDDELDRLLSAARKRGLTQYAMVVMALATGMRQGELLRLRWSDIDFERARVRVLLTKTGEARAVHLPAVAIEALQAIRPDGEPSAHCFLYDGRPYTTDYLYNWWPDVRTEAGLTDFRWHDLRHSCASFLAQQGASLLEIGSVLGHKSPAATWRYSHLVQGAPVTGHTALDAKLRRP